MALRTLCKGLAWACALTLIGEAKAGHEVSYYPSFYPQEIRIEPRDPATAAREFVNKADPLHAYLGNAPGEVGLTRAVISDASETSDLTCAGGAPANAGALPR